MKFSRFIIFSCLLTCLVGASSALRAQAQPATRPAATATARPQATAKSQATASRPSTAVRQGANTAARETREAGRAARNALPPSDIGRVVKGRGAGYPGYGDTRLAPYVLKYDPPIPTPIVLIMLYTLFGIVIIICLYAVRHYWFTFNRLFGKQRHPYIDIDAGDWPTVTVVIAAHNEEDVIEGILGAMLEVDYPHEKLQIMPMNDRSSDRTREIIDEWTARYPDRITPFHREKGKPGKAAALIDATKLITSEIIMVFDADYIPGRGLIKQLAAPFYDPEVGAVMGRVVPSNVASNLLTRLLDLERTGGYQVDQQARMNMRLVPAYAGTVGGIRMDALRSVGGWSDDALAEDTDITYKLLLNNWLTVYQNRSECYEEVPQEWPVRMRQIMRWSRGHNQCLRRYFWRLFKARHISFSERLDGLMLLGVYLMSPMLLIGCVLALVLFFMGANPLFGVLAIFAVAAYGTMGNFAAFFEIAAAARLDGSRNRIRLLPFNMMAFLVSTVCISRSSVGLFSSSRTLKWDKTTRYRQKKSV